MVRVSEMLPRPPVHLDVVIPFTRGDLVSEAHRAGEVVSETHADDGYHLVADVSESLAVRIREAVVTP